ncbi:D-inositol-3-phosphate glycosyltransferase [ANME-1 cluster archaeon GoMg3.2]|nr:D-inositol-3-phosphate glycosyltransferase [ANME-1 cluster archaeon GoMg3.2]
MRILQVIHYFSPLHGGGSVNSAYNLSKQLAKRGHDVTIITTDFEFDDEYIKSVEKEGVKVIPFHCIVNISSFLFSPSMKKWLKTNIKNFDVVHMHNFRTYQNSIVHYYANKYGISYILQARGDIPFVYKQRLKKIYDWIWGYKILKDAPKAIALTKIEAEDYKKWGVDDDKIEIVPNGIDLSEYDNLPKSGEFRKKYSIRADEKVILYLGRIHKIKGIDLLVRAFADLVKELDDVRLVIVGPDDRFLSTLKSQIEDLKIGDKILFIGPLFEKDKLKAYVDADVYVLPSVYEVFGNTVLEACACGTPVIVTDRCGIADFVDKLGCVVGYNKNQLRDAIIKILSDEGLRGRFGEAGRRLVMEEFDWDGIVRKIEGVYEDCVKGGIR